MSFIFNIILVCCLSITVPSLSFEFRKCKASDLVCMKESAQEVMTSFGDGIPEYKVKRLDPYYKDRIDLTTPSLKTVLQNITMSGLKKCKITNLNFENLKMTGQAECDLKLESDYQMDGMILILPIQGKGKARVGLKNLVVNVEGNFVEAIGKDGKNHWNIKSYTHSYEIRGKSFIRLDNLFNGNQALSRAVNELLDSSPNDVILEMAPPFVDFLAKLCLENVSHFLRAVPTEDLFLE